MTDARSDLLVGVLMLLFAGLLFVFSFHFTGQAIMEQSRDVGPVFLPRLLLIALGLQAIYLVLDSARRLAAAGRRQPPSASLWQARPWLVFAAFALYVWLATILGYLLATLAFMLLSFNLLGARRWWQLILLPPALTFGIYYLFSGLLEVWLPKGSFF